MRRTEGLEAAAVIAAAAQDPLNFELAGPAADMEVLSGNLDAGFARLIAIVAASADSREPARERLLELFRTQPANSESVIKARKALTSALF
ncbi:MAG: hypothetical protein CR980_00215 [Propionibacteriales bacterium]|nr:MAG: hypothetical protein CR980_00215 [Propionibacteriales bacterium]